MLSTRKICDLWIAQQILLKLKRWITIYLLDSNIHPSENWYQGWSQVTFSHFISLLNVPYLLS